MRIAQVAPLSESVPPALYGGTERIVHSLTESLVRRGHEVTLFASGDSVTSAELVSCAPRGLRLGHVTLPNAHTMIELGRVARRAGRFDVIHNHIDFLAYPLARLTRTPVVTTQHGRLDLPDLPALYDEYHELPMVSISDAQRGPLPSANWIATVPNGIAMDHFALRERPGRYLAFLGRISPEKRPDRAIEIARSVGMPLRLAAKIDPVDRAYYEHAIRPLIHDDIEYVGEVDEAQKDVFLGEAYAYLFPIDWPEPFGMTMVEAMACGTPVIAMDLGSVPEVVVDGVTGFRCRTLAEMIAAVGRVPEIDRAACRAHAERHFSVERMTDGYERVYRTLVRRSAARQSANRAPLPAPRALELTVERGHRG